MPAAAYIDANVEAPGQVKQTGAVVQVVLGEADGSTSQRCARIVETLVEAGIHAQVSEDIQKTLWTKFLYIASMAGVTGDKPDQIFAQARVDIDSQSAERMASLAEDDRSALLWELRFELLRAGLQFSGISLPMERFQFYQRIFLEDLNRSTLLSLVSNLRRGRLLAQSTLERKLWS